MEKSDQYYTLESDKVRVTLEPGMGGKIRSFYSQHADCEYLYQDLRQELDGQEYSKHDISGIDECFPTVMPCEYPNAPWRGVPLGDHGLLWNRPWTVDVRGEKLVANISLDEIPVQFTRTAQLIEPETLLLQYAIENSASEPIEYLYAAHMLLHANQGTTITYPSEMDQAYLSVVFDNPVLKEGAWNKWPPPETALLSEPLLPERNTLVKLFSPKLHRGVARVAHGDQSEQLQIEFDTERLPYLAVLLSLGYGPLGKDGKSLLFGLEPTSGIGDDLAMCRATNTVQRIAAGETLRFWMRLSLVTGSSPD